MENGRWLTSRKEAAFEHADSRGDDNGVTEDASDAFDLARFVHAQSDSYAAAVSELGAGQKRSHWMWFIFPQVAGLGSSAMAQRYAIRSRTEAEAYLAHPVLGPRLVECAQALLRVDNRSAESIMGRPDYLKLQSSMSLFVSVSPPDSIFQRVLEKYYAGAKDMKTVAFLRMKAGE